jgi:predicted secreted hydrolase
MRLFFLFWLFLAGPAWAGQDYAPVVPGRTMAFPADHGAHPDYRTEWWYVTGWLRTAKGERLGFQVTFFRTRLLVDAANTSRFAPRQILFAHAALSDAKQGRLLHAERTARAGFGLAEARVGDMDLVIDDWTMVRGADGVMRARVKGADFALDLALTPTQPVLLQGDKGFSRKGPGAGEASHYYTMPQLKVSGRVVRGKQDEAVDGTAWLDREWSSTLLNPAAVGWDWLGLNMDDGGAMTLFRMRRADGTTLWAGGSYRSAAGALSALGVDDVRFVKARRWKSPRTGAVYPVAPVVEVRLPDGVRRVTVRPLMDDQELDSRRGGGPVYWEGAVEVDGGRGYLEMTGYQAPLKM